MGVGVQEAFQLLENAAGIFYAFTYLALFAIPIFAARRLSEPPPLWLRISAACGFAVTLLYIILSVFPIIDVPSWKIFAAKIIVVLVGANLLGIGIYFFGRLRAGRAAAP
jgi:amino acid transporter